GDAAHGRARERGGVCALRADDRRDGRSDLQLSAARDESIGGARERRGGSRVSGARDPGTVRNRWSEMIDVDLRCFEQPDEVRTFQKGRFELVTIGGLTIGRAIYQPGWKWSIHVGPLAG